MLISFMLSFCNILTPRSILNDVVLNKRTSITDQAALKDAKRSLTVMLYDFLTQHV